MWTVEGNGEKRMVLHACTQFYPLMENSWNMLVILLQNLHCHCCQSWACLSSYGVCVLCQSKLYLKIILFMSKMILTRGAIEFSQVISYISMEWNFTAFNYCSNFTLYQRYWCKTKSILKEWNLRTWQCLKSVSVKGLLTSAFSSSVLPLGKMDEFDKVLAVL